jgi:hypothetical protein
MTPADEIRAAAFQLRNPFHLPGLNVAIDSDVAEPLAELLETAAEYISPDSVAHPTHVVRALAVARAILGTQETP